MLSSAITTSSINCYRCNLVNYDVTKYTAGDFTHAVGFPLRLSNVGIINPYIQMQLPPMPVVHPYQPEGNEPRNQRHSCGIPIFSVTAQLCSNSSNITRLPSDVYATLKQHQCNLDIYFCVQNMPWKDEALLLRPHPWSDSNAPYQGFYDTTNPMSAAVFDFNAASVNLVSVEDVRTHRGDNGLIVFSRFQMEINSVQDFNETHCFYSYCVAPKLKRAALTFHWLLNDNDHNQIQRILTKVKNLDEFVQEAKSNLKNSVINGFETDDVWNPITSLNALRGIQKEPNRYIENKNSQYSLIEQKPRLKLKI